MLNIIDEYSRECLLSFASRRITSAEVVEFLAELFCSRGLPEYIRSDNGSEFTAKKVRKFISNLGTYPAFIEPGSPWENGYVESFNGKMRDELLNAEIFDTMAEAVVLIERWRTYYNTVRPHSSLDYRKATCSRDQGGCYQLINALNANLKTGPKNGVRSRYRKTLRF